MHNVPAFFVQEKRKIITTLIVSSFFLYFWVNGPILYSVSSLNLESIATKYSRPIMVGKDGVDKKGALSSYKTIEFEKDDSFGNGLILDIKAPKKNGGLISDTKNNPALSEALRDKILEHAKQFSSQNATIEVLASPDLYYATIVDKEKTAIYLESTDVVKNIRGYAGSIHVGVFLDKDGHIEQIEYISSKETESYLSDIKNSGFYKQFDKIPITKGNQQIDAVSGATISSKAIAGTVAQLIKKSIPYPLSNYTNVDEVNPFNLSAVLNYNWIVHIMIIFLMFAFAVQRWFKKTKKSIVALNLLSVIYLGFFLNSSFTYVSFLHPFLGTSVSSFVGLYSLFVLLGAIWGKNTYCKYICPFGNIQRFIIHVNPVKTGRKFFIKNKWIKRIRAAITIILIAGILLGLRNWSNYELFPDLFGLSIAGVWFVIAIITVLTTLVYPMIWCRLLCPTGSLLDGLSDLMKLKIKSKVT